MHFNTVITGNVEADLFHNHKIMTVSSLLLDAQSDLVYITSKFFVKHFKSVAVVIMESWPLVNVWKIPWN